MILQGHVVCLRTYSVPDTTASVSNASYMTCYDKLDHQEVKDMLICFLYIVSNLSEGNSLHKKVVYLLAD